MQLADRREAIEGRHEYGAGYWPLRGKMRSDSGPETAPKNDDTMPVDIFLLRDRIVDQWCVGDELAFSRHAFARPVTAIVHAHDGPLAWPACVRYCPRHFFGIAAEVDYGGCRCACALGEPTAKPHAVSSDNLERLDVRRELHRSSDGLRKKDEVLLAVPGHSAYTDRDSGEHDEPFHASVPPSRWSFHHRGLCHAPDNIQDRGCRPFVTLDATYPKRCRAEKLLATARSAMAGMRNPVRSPTVSTITRSARVKKPTSLVSRPSIPARERIWLPITEPNMATMVSSTVA